MQPSLGNMSRNHYKILDICKKYSIITDDLTNKEVGIMKIRNTVKEFAIITVGTVISAPLGVV